MAAEIQAPREAGGRSLFCSGHFSDLIWQGLEPEYGYPKNHLPESVIPQMQVKTGFIAALDKRCET
jgi:hypothetical protein